MMRYTSDDVHGESSISLSITLLEFDYHRESAHPK